MKVTLLLCAAMLFSGLANAQLTITTQNNAQALAQRLVGDGITISNVTLSGDSISTGFFNNIAGTMIGLDSGIVLTNGRARTQSVSNFQIGMDGDGVTPANDLSDDAFADNQVNYNAHDADLAQLINIQSSDTHDATVLEFDFIPIGDSIKFRYVFSSEEYPDFACPIGGGTLFNDAFAFFIQGPGFPVKTNIALIPGTTDPVTIHNINDQGCAPYPQYYINNETNVNFTHNGHTTVLTALAEVQPCQTYHLKLVIADVEDDLYDSGVLLEAKSLTSNIVLLTNNTQTDSSNNSYIVEGCVNGSFTIKRPHVTNFPLSVQLNYGGTVVNGVDVQTLPGIVTIPANDSVVTVDVIPIIDNIPEGIEYLKIFAGAGCGAVAPIDSTVIQIRDYDTLTILPHNEFICKNGSIQLNASAAYSGFEWDPVPGLDNYTVNNPIATPVESGVYYFCTATVGTCHGRDSVFLQWKELEIQSQVNVLCHGAPTGQIVAVGGPEWTSPPVQYSINNLPPQADGTFNNLITGNYMVHISEANGCTDSIPVNIVQSFPDLVINDAAVIASSCTGADGSITVTANGGLAPYLYSVDGTGFQTGNVFTLSANTYTVTITDANHCSTVLPDVIVPFVNNLTLTAGPDTTICSGQSVTLFANSTADTYSWQPATGLSTPANPTTIASPSDSITYTVTATLGSCVQTASVKINIEKNLTVEAGGPIDMDAGGAAQVQATVGGGNTNLSAILWTGSTGLSATNILNPVVTPPGINGTAIYNITVTNTSGCTASDELLVNIIPNCIKVKNAFTPNGDGNNDLYLVYEDYSCLKNVAVHVFNRYGSKVFESRDYRNTWDGTYKGKSLPDGTYYAVIDFTLLSGRTKTIKTDLTILR